MGRHREGYCNHFNGTANKRCCAGVEYESVKVKHDPLPGPNGYKLVVSHPCIAKYNLAGATCEKRETPTDAQVAAQNAEDDRKDDLLRRGLSWCCEVPIDRSQVITSGRYKGHGRRYCSKCGKLLFMV